MKEFIRKKIREHVGWGELNQLEKELDALFKNVGVDVEFTRHFLDRVNDSRNKKPIDIEELKQMFYDIFQQYGKKFRKLPHGEEGVMKNPPNHLNIPFTLDKNTEDKLVDLINKTIMRKKDFHPSPTDTVLNLQKKVTHQSEPKQKEPIIKINGVNWVIDVDNEALVKKNKRSQTMKLDDIMDKLPDEAQEKILSYF